MINIDKRLLNFLVIIFMSLLTITFWLWGLMDEEKNKFNLNSTHSNLQQILK